MEKVTLNVEGMSCSHCVNAITQAMNSCGINEVEINLENKTVTLNYDDTQLSLAEIKREIEDQGYEVV